MIKFGPKKQVQEKAMQKPTSGSFSIKSDPLEWTNCRERFAELFRFSTSLFYFTHDSRHTERIVEFIDKTETILELPIDQRTQFFRTNRNYCLAVNAAFFWRTCPMRRSLFTIFMRGGSGYLPEHDNYEEALFGVRYAQQTKEAVMRFLFGFTTLKWPSKPNENFGWVSAFNNKSVTYYREHLISDREDISVLGTGTIWG